MPAALLSITMLYDTKPDFGRSMDLFEYAVRHESGNPVGPAMQAVYFDLLTSRADEIPERLRPWGRLAGFVGDLKHEKPVAVLETMLLARLLMRTKLEQSKITALAGSQNCTIRQADRTLKDVERSLLEYKSLVSAFNKASDRRLKNLRKKESTGDAEEWEVGWLKSVEAMTAAMSLYSADLGRLRTLVSKLAEEQVMRKPKAAGSICWVAVA
jgi:hypothetical protein